MENDIIRKLMTLPSEWWRLSGVTLKLSEWFSQYIIGLVVSAEYSGRYFHYVLSGFLVSFDDLLLWVTAGHVIDDLKKELSHPAVRLTRLRWLDGFPISGAESIPILSGLESFSATEIGIQGADFGFIRISGIEESNLRKNSKVQFFTQQAWKDSEKLNPEGFYLLGFPRESLQITNESEAQPGMWVNLAIVPVTRIQPKDKSCGRFWDDPDSFYGQIVPFADHSGSQPQDIAFMSGGPIISVERDPNSGIRYRLFAIQRSWLKDKRVIRGEMLYRIFPQR
jgi:hypothetical protein